jgi:hypothetical protein
MLLWQRMHATIEDLLGASFSLQFVSFQRKVGDQFFPQFLIVYGEAINLFCAWFF